MNELENKYVYEVYNSISNEFDNTRQYPWPVVKTFMNNLKPNSFVCDVGSGNGKNMFRNDLIYTSTDLSEKMCELSANKSDCIQSNILSLPFKDNTFDAVLCIACVHHLSTNSRRKKAIDECYRILRPNGKMIISVWANSDKYGEGDQYIKWNNHETRRFYHLFSSDELQNMCSFDCEIVEDKYNLYSVK